MTEALIDVTVASKIVLAEDIVGLELAAANGKMLPEFSAGSHIDVHLGNGLIRQYSLCNNPSESSRYCLGVLKETQGRGGSRAAHALQAGQNVRISAPRNHFALDESANSSTLIAGGIGITPILAMAKKLHENGSDFKLHYCARSRDRMAFRDYLLECEFADKVSLYFDDEDELGFDFAALKKPPPRNTHLYVCGPQGFMDAVISAAEQGWPSSNIHREYFNVAEPASLEGEQPFLIRIASTGQTLEVPADMSAIDVLEGVGIEIPKSCEQGICGTCVTKVLEGKPDHRDFVLTDEEHAENDRMTVCCSRALTETLVLDL